MTERITEDLVRSHFKADPIFDQMYMDEQKSTRDRVQTLFATASKSQTGKPGYPEFIIGFNSNSKILIVIECKLDVARHESKKHNKPKDYAVDGVLHYVDCANNVDNSFNIIGIAVSGRKKGELEVSHFYSEAGSNSYVATEDNKLLSIQSYLKLHQNELFAKELSNLQIQQKAVEYNNTLHYYEIPEHERCTFISAVLVALQDNTFRATYAATNDVSELIDLVISACDRVLKKNGITEDRRATIVRQYEQIRNHKITTVKVVRNRLTGKEEQNEAILAFIDSINKEIYPLVLFEEQGFDVLGRFYREFVRYAGADPATGLVLTPEHIADLFCDLVDLKVGDIVYDPCCGTGGFLIAALKSMLAQAGNDASRIKNIKESQLIGSEMRTDMFTYACSNMMMRGDGKSQIYHSDCFSSEQKSLIRKKKPTVAMLNPPYSRANGPANQLEFVTNALSDLEPGGRCAAIVQMACALTSRADVVAQHKSLMKKHRLEAVISVPDQLFYPIAVNTCIMVFTAHTAHPKKYPTWFGYLKDDGFIIHKKKGRIPLNWGPARENFLALYPHFDKPGLSVRAHVEPEDEWCAEAYLETDFSLLKKSDFEEKLRKFLGYRYLSGAVDNLFESSERKGSFKLDTAKWKKFRYDEIFEIKKGYYNKKPPISEGSDDILPFVGATDSNNGVTSFHDRDDVMTYGRNGEENPSEPVSRKIFSAVSIAVTNNGSVGNAFLQIEEYTCSHDVNPLYLIDREMSSQEGIFLCAVIEIEKYRWSYGRKWRPTRMPSSIIKLPVDAKGNPDWKFMGDFIAALPQSINLPS